MSRTLRFLLVGASGVGVNLGVVALLDHLLSAPRVASAGGIVVSILTNFLLNDAWTWADRARGARLGRLVRYVSVAGLTGSAQWIVAFVVHTAFGEMLGALYLGQLVGIGCGTVLNYVGNDRWTFG